ncbi:hypothetical protein [Cellulomonas cellasea]|uniref:hypothetical protein n=1 Tax=Cellulomonas cellasea TaxID=43670 RepID=UPI00160F1131|nr:hypothetical protein [Cellulomonas cellasea]
MPSTPAATSSRRGGRRIAHAAAGAICFLGAVLVIASAAVAVQDSGPHRLALQLREHQSTAPVERVTLYPNSRGRGRVEVTFHTDGRTVVADAAGADAATVSTDPADLTVAHPPGDPYRAMLTDDIDHYADDALPEAGAAATVGLATVAAGGIALVALDRRTRRTPARHAGRR